MKSLDQLTLHHKRVLLRVDMNVPLSEEGKITDDHRIRASLPTIQYLREAGASVVICSHLGQPDGKRDSALSLRPVAERLGELLQIPVPLAPDCVGPEVEQQAKSLSPREVLLLENLRFHPAEEANEEEFCRKLASLAEVYVNDAFAVNHRAHASTTGVAQFFAEKAAGITLTKEMDFFNRAFSNPQRPLVVIFGGAKVSTKMKAIQHVIKSADVVLIGGAMANTFFVAQGLEVGNSLYEPEQVEAAREIIKSCTASNCRLVLPTDVIVAAALRGGVAHQCVSVGSIPADQKALDIGPDTLKQFADACRSAKTIVWNGPVGAFEIEEFSAGTFGVIDILIASAALTVVGGGDTDLALHQAHAMEKMSYVSTGGGAFLKLLEGKSLPGVKALL